MFVSEAKYPVLRHRECHFSNEKNGGEKMKRNVIIAVLAMFCLTATLFMVSSSLGYDPWADINEDGQIEIKDIAYSARLYGSSGDPTKNVTVTNWPVHEAVTVIWEYQLVNGAGVGFGPFQAEGFSTLHVLMYAIGLTA